MKKYAFIINPVAGKVKKLNVSELIKNASEMFAAHSKLYYTEYRGHAIEIAKELTSNGDFDCIVAVGGDGTVNEVVNGFDLNSGKKFGILPFGSGNDVSRYLYTGDDYLGTIMNAHNHTLTHFDIGNCVIKNSDETKTERRFINAVGIGFDAYVAFLNQTGNKLTGVISYVFSVIKALKTVSGLDISMKIDDQIQEGKYLLVTIGNGKTSGGGFYLNPDAVPTDEILEITTIDLTSKVQILKNLPLALVNKLKKVKQARFFSGKIISLNLEQPYYVHLDGEVVSNNVSDLNISIERNKLPVITSK